MMSDLAFAGLVRQAQLVRDGEVTSRELVELSLERIERFDPELNAFGAVYAEQALAEADHPRPGPLSGVPIAVKDEMDIGGEITSRGTGAITERAPRGLRGRAPAARRGRDRGRQDDDARARAVAVHRVDHVGRHPQPVGHRPHAGRLERRLGGRGGGRARAGGGGRRRRRLDPHPRRVLRAVRAQAAHRARAARAARRRRRPLDLLRRPDALGRGRGADVRRDGAGHRPRGAAAAAGSPTPRRSRRSPPASSTTRRARRCATPPRCCKRPRPHGRSSATSTSAPATCR